MEHRTPSQHLYGLVPLPKTDFLLIDASEFPGELGLGRTGWWVDLRPLLPTTQRLSDLPLGFLVFVGPALGSPSHDFVKASDLAQFTSEVAGLGFRPNCNPHIFLLPRLFDLRLDFLYGRTVGWPEYGKSSPGVERHGDGLTQIAVSAVRRLRLTVGKQGIQCDRSVISLLHFGHLTLHHYGPTGSLPRLGVRDQALQFLDSQALRSPRFRRRFPIGEGRRESLLQVIIFAVARGERSPLRKKKTPIGNIVATIARSLGVCFNEDSLHRS